MSVLQNFVRVAGALSACAVLTAAPAAAAPGGPAEESAAPAAADATDASPVIAALGRAGETAAPSDWFTAYGETLGGLQALGVDPFLYPTAAPFCLGSTTLGIAPAVAGTIPGPWPRYTVSIPGLDLSAVKAGQAMFAFVPYGLNPDGADTAGMQVAWLNLSNGKSGFTPMGPLNQVLSGMIPPAVPGELRPVVERAVHDYFAGALPQGGVRAVPVDTGSGTVLAAMFGLVRNGQSSCFFFPTVGITPVP
ncbi:hypothetical protein [Nocardia sp. IFM 10818]